MNNSTQLFFYNSSKLTSIKHHNSSSLSIFQAKGTALSQLSTVEAGLYVADQQNSILNTNKHQISISAAYTPYGYKPKNNNETLLLFNGHRKDTFTDAYLLGNGYRTFSTRLMRFTSPDSFSPFSFGGINPYAYVAGDPINNSDPSGRGKLSMKRRYSDSNIENFKTPSHAPQHIKNTEVVDLSGRADIISMLGENTYRDVISVDSLSILKEAVLFPTSVSHSGSTLASITMLLADHIAKRIETHDSHPYQILNDSLDTIYKDSIYPIRLNTKFNNGNIEVTNFKPDWQTIEKIEKHLYGSVSREAINLRRLGSIWREHQTAYGDK